MMSPSIAVAIARSAGVRSSSYIHHPRITDMDPAPRYWHLWYSRPMHQFKIIQRGGLSVFPDDRVAAHMTSQKPTPSFGLGDWVYVGVGDVQDRGYDMKPAASVPVRTFH